VAYIFSLVSATADYGIVPNFAIVDESTHKGFSSLYQVTAETAKAIEQAGTVKGFKGIVWSKRLWIDFDDSDAARAADRRLKEMGYDYVCYSTGNRGLHYGILRPIQPSHLLPLMDKAWVKEHFPKADTSIYTHLHPFRIPGTVHEKTGRPKILLFECRGSALTLPPLKREEMQIVSPGFKQGKSVFDCFYVMANTVPVSPGQRHETMVKLLYALKNDAGVSMDIAMWWASEWNRMLSEPKEDHEIEKAVRSIYER